MAKLLMITGGVVAPGANRGGAVCAYVVYSMGRGSRIFKVAGPSANPDVSELPPATTVDMSRFEHEVRDALGPTADAFAAKGENADVVRPDNAWVCEIVRVFLREREGIEV